MRERIDGAASVRREEPQRGGMTWSEIAEQQSFLKRAALRVLGPRPIAGADASDLVHDSLIEAHRCTGDYRGGRLESRAWLLKVLRTRISRLRRRAGRTTCSLEPDAGGSPADSGTSPSAAAIGLERAGALAQVLPRLEPKDRKLLMLKYERGLDFHAIAAAMDLPSSSAARKRHLRALGRLRVLLGPGLDPF